ncbi:hypothetical protein N0V93_006908 [Gnomoniopsis smithogilvyi]|uniref:J domain-containing protein n=1 Tax=Gnomoniopsis smithogilvyi TaxID=1191159 RepID=A0A9W8YPH8_9PEZI|nr:hypothetical protein N0V93_006908 [Gnomoniopsis smithogilvyi]
MATLPRSLGSFAPTRHRLFSLPDGEPSSVNHKHPERSLARLVRVTERRWNHQRARSPAAAPTREEVEEWYVKFDVAKATPYPDIKKEYYKRSKLYHQDIAGSNPDARKKWQEILDLYEKFTIIHNNGHKAIIDQEIEGRMTQRRAELQAAVASFAATRAAAKARSIQEEKERQIKEAQKKEKKAQEQRIIEAFKKAQKEKQAQKEKDDAMRKAAIEQKIYGARPHAPNSNAEKATRTKRKQDHNSEDVKKYTGPNSKTNKTSQDGVGDPPNTGSEASTKTRRPQPEIGVRSAQPKTKQRPPSLTRRLAPVTWKGNRESDKLARSRIVTLCEIPMWADLVDVYHAILRYKPGAVYDIREVDSNYETFSVRLEFFHSSAARETLRLVNAGGLVVRHLEGIPPIVKSFTVSHARIGLADNVDLGTSFSGRILMFLPSWDSKDNVVPSFKSWTAFVKHYNVRPRILKYEQYDRFFPGLSVWFESVEDAEAVFKVFEKHHPGTKVEILSDDISSISPSSNDRQSSGDGPPVDRQGVVVYRIERTQLMNKATRWIFCGILLGLVWSATTPSNEGQAADSNAELLRPSLQ